jgi:drug/metabolite transporter (DMT)-like permease
MTKGKNHNLIGIAYMMIGMFGMAANDAAAKWLVADTYSPFQVIAVRGGFATLFLLIWIALSHQWGQIRTKRPMGHLFRMVISFLGPTFLFFALRYMPLADVTVLIFSAAFLTAILSIPIFKERIGPHRWGAILIGFVGVAVAMRPGTEVFQPAMLLALLAGLCFAGTNLTSRWLGDTESILRITLFTLTGTAVLGWLFMPALDKPIPPGDLAIMAAMATFTLIGYFFMTRAFVMAPMGLIAPFEYTAFVWAVLFGFLLWGDVPDGFIWGGAFLIVGSGLYLIYREARQTKNPNT